MHILRTLKRKFIMKNNVITVAALASLLGGCALIDKDETTQEPSKEIVKYQCADCESETSRLKQEITSLGDQLASTKKDLDEANRIIAEDTNAPRSSSSWTRLLVNIIGVLIGVGIGYFVFRDKKKV